MDKLYTVSNKKKKKDKEVTVAQIMSSLFQIQT